MKEFLPKPKKGVRLQDIVKLFCISETLSQVWKNIIFNAVQAMYTIDSKKLEIKIEILNGISEEILNMKSSRLERRSLERMETEKYIAISFIDSGVGIACTRFSGHKLTC